MGKHKKAMKKYTLEFLEKNKETLDAGQDVPISSLSVARDNVCGYCSALSIALGGTKQLSKCGRCLLAYYCCRECQVADWKNHKALCKDKQEQVSSVNASVMSVPQMMKLGRRLLVNDIGTQVECQMEQAAPLPLWTVAKTPVSVMRVSITSADRTYNLEVSALFSTAAQVSTASESLAKRLGLKKSGEVFCSGLRCADFTASLPSRHVDISCLDVIRNHNASHVPESTRMALLIAPHAGNDLVIGSDWYSKIQDQSGCDFVLDFAPDKSRLHFLPPSDDENDNDDDDDTAYNEESLVAFASLPYSANNYIELPWGRPDPGPCYDPNPNFHDFTHHVRPEQYGRTLLEAIAAAE